LVDMYARCGKLWKAEEVHRGLCMECPHHRMYSQWESP
jgi:hypothetical protein